MINASLGAVVGALEFTAVAADVLPSDKLGPGGFGPGIVVAYDDVPAWDGEAAYQAGDAVSFGGSAWVAKRANKDIPPADGDDWGGPHGRRQTLTFRGLLSDAREAQLTANNSSAVLAQLLGAVRNQTDAL